MKSLMIGVLSAVAVAHSAFASDFEEAPRRVAFECASPEIGRVVADLELDFGHYYGGIAVHFDVNGQFIEAFAVRQDVHRNLGAIFYEGKIGLSIPHSGEPDWSAHDQECVAPAPHAGGSLTVSLQDPAHSTIELIEDGVMNPRAGMVFEDVGAPWPVPRYVLDGKVCEEGTSKYVELPVNCVLR